MTVRYEGAVGEHYVGVRVGIHKALFLKLDCAHVGVVHISA